jgi:hypothetical protein
MPSRRPPQPNPALERAVRQHQLLERSGALREALCADLAGLAPLAHGADRALQASRWITRHRKALAATLALALVLKPRLVFKAFKWGLQIWHTLPRKGVLWQGLLAVWKAAVR